jgi:hypothetical protein
MKTAWKRLGLAGLLWLLAMGARADDGDGPGHWWERSIWSDPDRNYQWYPPTRHHPRRPKRKRPSPNLAISAP